MSSQLQLGRPALQMDTLGFEPRAFRMQPDVIPLHHVPHASFLLQGHIVAASLRNVGYLWHNQW